MDRIADKAKKLIEQARGTLKKGTGVRTGSGKRSLSEKRDGSSLADRVTRTARESLK
jgi:uncharacterized protein YjbJ (UPF0337 family)